jgi:hypothetical protein
MPTTTDPALKPAAIAAAIADLYSGIDGLTVLSYDPIGSEITAATACIAEMRGLGTGIDQRGHQLGRDDYSETWIVRLYHPLEDPETDIPAARSLLLQMVAACNDDWELSGEVREAVCIAYSLEPSVPEEGRRRLMLGTIEVGLLYLLPFG